MTSDQGTTHCKLLCPICEGPNGTWTIHFKPLFESGATVLHRKRCKHCRTRVLYKAWKAPEGVAVNALLDKKSRVDIAKYFNVGLPDVEKAIELVLEEREERAEGKSTSE